jgi:hypothetical protein
MATKVAKKVTKKAKAKATSDKNVLELKPSEPRRTMHYYTAKDGTRVEEVLNIPPPKKLSKGALWRMANPDKYKDAYVNWEAILN